MWIPEDEDIRELTKASENKEGKYYDEKDEAADEPQMDAEDRITAHGRLQQGVAGRR